MLDLAGQADNLSGGVLKKLQQIYIGKICINDWEHLKKKYSHNEELGKHVLRQNLRDKRVTVMNKNSEVYGPCRNKTTFHRVCISTDDNALTGESVRQYNF